MNNSHNVSISHSVNTSHDVNRRILFLETESSLILVRWSNVPYNQLPSFSKKMMKYFLQCSSSNTSLLCFLFSNRGNIVRKKNVIHVFLIWPPRITEYVIDLSQKRYMLRYEGISSMVEDLYRRRRSGNRGVKRKKKMSRKTSCWKFDHRFFLRGELFFLLCKSSWIMQCESNKRKKKDFSEKKS